MNLGTVNSYGFDAQGRERRERLEAIVDCDTCGKEVALWSETEAWTQDRDKQRHSEYGAAQGVCCQNLYISSFEGCFRYRLSHDQ